MGDPPRVLVMSLWRNDEDRELVERVAHLLDKSYPNLRWLWLVGDSSDGTEAYLRHIATLNHFITVIRADSGIPGADPASRIARLNEAVVHALDAVPETVEYCLWHESDLSTPKDVVERLFATNVCPVAGWTTLEIDGRTIFYDTTGYTKDGVHFSNLPPYHPGYRKNELFSVDSFGSCFLFHADDARSGVRPSNYAIIEFSRLLRERGRVLWVDPTIEVIQPRSRWVPQTAAPFSR